MIDKAEAQNFKNLVQLSVKSLYIIGFLWLPCYRRKRTVSLRVFSENPTFHSVYVRKTKISASSLNTLYISKSAQFTLHFHQQRLVLLRAFAENAKFDPAFLPKTHSYEDTAKFNIAIWSITLSHASRFRRKRGVIKNLKYLRIFKNFFKNVGRTAFWIY